ncbi:MAG: hypothetical protein KAW09_02345, partial [Thermoplasmata archaeon]|nr:hypothetical protein [Thermoplasmata archaeon]
AFAYEEAGYQSIVLRAEAASELVQAQMHLAKARGFESKAARILVRKAVYEADIARLRARSRLFKSRAHEYEKYHQEEGVDSFKEEADSRHFKSRSLIKQAKMREKQIDAIEEKAKMILKQAEEHLNSRREHESEAMRLEGEAVNVQRDI